MAVYVNINRDSSKDIISKPERLYAYTNQNPSGETLYTDTTTLTTGMTLYDNTGTDTGLKVGAISGDSFDIKRTITITLVVQSMPTSGGAGSGTVNSVSFTSDGGTITPNTIEVNAGESCTITALNAKGSDPNTSAYYTYIYLNGTQVASHGGTATYTFTPTKDCTIGIFFDTEK